MPTVEDHDLILAAEDCVPEHFEQLHHFSASDGRLIAKLMAHGPVLLRGGRGSGKSALMIEAKRRLAAQGGRAPAVGIYLSLRHLELLKPQGPGAYERALCQIITSEVQKLDVVGRQGFSGGFAVNEVRAALASLSSVLDRRIVLLFDDAAHIGREASLEEFFDVFRTISSSSVSCKASIYPGVTKFGTRFDVFNDATVIDVTRSEELADFDQLFTEIMHQRFGFSGKEFSKSLTDAEVAGFLGRAVIGNMRAFVFACNTLNERIRGRAVGLHHLSEVLLSLAANHFWPLLEELRPKLGTYEPMIDPAKSIAEIIFLKCGQASGRRMVTVHRDLTERLSKPFEMLEYTGFIAKREGSRSLKTGGRGPRFAVNLCNLLEKTPGSRLTKDVFKEWSRKGQEPVEFYATAQEMIGVNLPPINDEKELGIFQEEIERLAKSNAYPYGLTDAKIQRLRNAGIKTVKQLASASDQELKQIDTISDGWVQRCRNIVGQAIWM